jgi:hypothetical protein
MTVTKSIPADRLRGLEIGPGDTLRVLEMRDENVLVEIRRADSAPPSVPLQAREWLRTARGSVRLGPNESHDDARMAYYAKKYRLGA